MSASRTQATRTGDFDFTQHMRRLCKDMCARTPELSHIDLSRVAIGYRQARKSVAYGLQATLTPMRFEGGGSVSVRDGGKWTIQRLYDGSGREMLYLLNFYLPRFLNHSFREKLTTVVHELWHISPNFDGDLRRHPGRCYAHSHSQKEYDAWAEQLALRWLSLDPEPRLYEFLKLSFKQLARRHGAVVGMKIPAPKLLPTPAA